MPAKLQLSNVLKAISHAKLGTRQLQKIKLGVGTRGVIVWENINPPTIRTFSANPSSIDLDNRATGNLTLSAYADNSDRLQIFKEPEGENIPFTTGASLQGQTRVPGTAVFAQPQAPKTYRLVATNAGGSTHRDLTVEVTKNPTITNPQTLGSVDSGGGSRLYRFGLNVGGLPQPSLRYDFFDNGGTIRENGTIDSRHFDQQNQPWLWAVNWRITLGDSNFRRLRFTATNASGTATGEIANITI